MLIEGLVVVAAFGGLDAAGAAVQTVAGLESVKGGFKPVDAGGEATAGAAGASCHRVVNDDGGHCGLNMNGGGQAADIPAVTRGK